MDFQDFWHEHKVFIIQVGVGAAIYLVLTFVSQGMAAEANDLARRNDRRISNVIETENSLKNKEGIEKGRTEALQGNLEPQIFTRLIWTLNSQRVVPKDAGNRYILFTAKRREAKLKMRDAAKFDNIPLPKTYGFLNEANEDLVDEHLVRLDVTENLVITLIKGGANKIFRVSQGKTSYDPLIFAQGDAKFLRRLPVSIECEIESNKIPAVLEAFQNSGKFLQVDGFEILKRNKAKGQRLLMTVSALTLSNSDQVGKGGSSTNISNPGGSGGPKTFPNRPLRRFGGGRRRR